jgi:hypothetical protein
MPEDLLQYLWKFRKLNGNLKTKSGEEIVILNPGEHNGNSGPDFLNARIRIGETLWAGNVEIHVRQGDWRRHNHHLDKAYENVILHVVYQEEEEREDPPVPPMPVVVIKNHLPDEIVRRYDEMINGLAWIPCEKLIRGVDPFYYREWASALVLEKLTEKCMQWEQLLESNSFDWAETLHQAIAQVFGLRVNNVPFELLAKVLPLKLVLRHRESLFSLEALAFGQAGMLNKEFSDPYPNRLQQEYRHLAEKYSLRPMDPAVWKFLRLRPSSFPTVRIAQWAAALQNADRWFGLITEREFPDGIRELLSVTASGYWDSHFLFGKRSSSVKKRTGTPSVNLFILNAAAPFLFFYGKNKGEQELMERALRWIDSLPAEENHIITRWKILGFPAESALHTQALLRLKSTYCDRKRCLECRIGVKVICEM